MSVAIDSLHLQDAPNKDAILKELSGIDITVPPANEQRNRRKELYTFCRVAAALSWNDRFEYPVSMILHSTNLSPDGLISYKGINIGVEITQAGASDFNTFLSHTQDQYPEGYIFDGFPPRFTAYEIGDSRFKLTGPPWDGTDPERQFAEEISAAIQRKTKRLQRDEYHKYDLNWLAVYPLTSAPGVGMFSKNQLLAALRSSIRFDADLINFDSIFVIYSNGIIEITSTQLSWMDCPDLWLKSRRLKPDPQVTL